ncbi:dipeptidyl-peptidase 5 [Kordia sp. SMS9]|uniref:S9 family peptidase n=1 Tax=Kordia sp. SMS9 TaxID=2282170 RepID=UPI000E0DA6B7|nr:prolyl oligopeptidase family serine peptidase [Kordia sp. SMS9]AXG69930.1 dipeptidyl-peptidase 5 [Kordia sp. SMS9]
MTRTLLLLVFLFSFGSTIAQKKAITHDDYDLWEIITNTQISVQGKIIVSTIKKNTRRGDGYLEIYNNQTKNKARYFNGDESAITEDEKFVIFQKKVKYATKRIEKKDKVKEKDQQKEVLYIYDVANNAIYDSITRVKSYTLPLRNSNYFVVEKFKNKKDSIKGDSLPAWKNNYALVYDIKTKQQDTIFDIKDVTVPRNGNTFYYTTKHKKRKKKAKAIHAYNTATKTSKVIDSSWYDYKKLSANKLGNQLTFIADSDSTKTDSSTFKLYAYKNDTLKLLLDNEDAYLGKNETLSGTKQPFFSENSKRLYFYSKVKSLHKKDTTLLDDEIPEVDVWSWNDEITQPRQKANSSTYKEDTRLYSYNVEKERYVKLQDDVIDNITLFGKYQKKYVIGVDYTPYATETWKSPTERDYYVIDIETGKKRLLSKRITSSINMAPDGKHGFYFDRNTYDWISVDLETLQMRNLTQNLKVAFENERNDIPASARAYGNGGFDKEGNLLLYDRYDIWKVALDGSAKPKNITRKGRRKKTVYRTKKLNRKNWLFASYIDGKLLLSGFNEENKTSGIYLLDDGKLIERIPSDTHLISSYQKAEKADVFTFTKQTFAKYPDVSVTTDNFRSHTKITALNLQQKDFKWGTSELTSWKAYDGTKLEGIIYKPEDFDPNKKYPLMVYFYERNADNLNYYYSPKPSASTVNYPYLVSNDYIVFVPDIVYKTGQPGDDAYNCIVSGTEAMEKKGYIDSSRMAIQGQSWGGYQVAYLVTKTNKYKAAMAGAPVSNMTSAYGGIRWGSGYSRMFQYEKTQSRIGKNLWDGFDLYVKNSPLFHLPNVETPLLIMHNDNDGAVPYYQGIELFMGMRRLKKPAWLLVYNNEAHNLRKMKNKQDLSIRMMQFFDHYLKDAPAPTWMTKGVPRAEKGINFGYELDKQ